MDKINIWADIFNEWDYNGDDLYNANVRKTVKNMEEFLELISNIEPGKRVIIDVDTDITLDSGTPLQFESNTSVVLNLGENSIINPVNGDAAIKNYGNLVLKGGVIKNGSVESQGSDAIKNESGTLVIDGCEVGSDTNRGAAVRCNAGKVIINNGQFETIDRGLNQGWAYVFIANGPSAEIVINNAVSNCDPNGMFCANDGVVTVNGGIYRMGNFNKPTYYMAYVESGTVNLNKGTFNWTQGAGNKSTYIDGSGSINIANGVEIKETFKP